ncbi:hypothetical protein TWF569_007708 [Orbilia oligospora]|uniref:Uncharacterized protein n=1 Tax=Orbilia oligospora TaxID=2813651 RepID=A0A7C8N2E8_ORBOL|nr:hypothetical protein TWF102_007875 [Orbilia oligospora]KAF3106258.1 hypothetical protein TWF103_006359 [Orbilia oligospora]KAF3137811.1 hypothetical protein TWF594_007460 [Orbilia oligospora]KAF3141936.1 hypothetical protein TWF569_007708 [Orbilia oligospora]KAF3144646.1 hypothetical protein TWF703_008632 [Orbilia oligospora]
MRFHVPLPTYILGILVSLITAYEVALYPETLSGLDATEDDPLVFHVYPRFECNKAIFGSRFRRTQNVIIRTAEDAMGPGLLAFYSAKKDDPDPCKRENGILAGYFRKNVKPSTQVLFTDIMTEITHFMELTDQSELWAYLVDWMGMKPGNSAISYPKQKKKDFDSPPEWEFINWYKMDILPYDHDFGYATEEDLNLGIGSEGELDEAVEGVQWPETNAEYGSILAPGQKVPDDKVYRGNFRDWRNARYRFGDYRPITKHFTQFNSLDKLRDMGYIIDDAKELQIRLRRLEEKQKASEIERGYEEVRHNKMKAEEKYTGVSDIFKKFDFGMNVNPPQPFYQRLLQWGNNDFLEDAVDPEFPTFGGAPGVDTYNMYGGPEYLQQEGIEIEEEKEDDSDFAQRYGGPGQIEYEADNELGTDYLSTTQFLSSIQGESQGVPPRSPLYDHDYQ